MAKRKERPIVTHVELLCLAARHLQDEIDHWEAACADQPDAREAVAEITRHQREKLDAIMVMYKIETGTDMFL